MTDYGLLYLKEFWVTLYPLFIFQINFSIYKSVASHGYGDHHCWIDNPPAGGWKTIRIAWLWFWLHITFPCSKRKKLQFHYPEEYPPDKKYGKRG